jgi:RHH-type transcriptional regulator, proline utilization regulon repressor / proline dehydrogenase / delta 1-pyrroline-5-carboxylate dehydrogenase
VVIRVGGIDDLPHEVFGPVLHLARFRAADLPRVLARVNARGYGLTFGLHSRIDGRVQEVVGTVRAGNIYVNRNQIGAVVGSQPFGGEGLSGTGPKAGGPHYLHRFTRAAAPAVALVDGATTTASEARARLTAPLAVPQARTIDLPGPTGESNRLTQCARAPVLCLGPGAGGALAQAEAIRALGGVAVEVPGLEPEALAQLEGFSGAIWWGDAATARHHAQALARRSGPILPLVTDEPDAAHATLERHACIDTTASGGNAQLLAEVGA